MDLMSQILECFKTYIKKVFRVGKDLQTYALGEPAGFWILQVNIFILFLWNNVSFQLTFHEFN